MAYKRWLIPLGLAILAVALVALGVLWAVATGTAIPDPEATPTMKAYERYHHRIVAVMWSAAAISFVIAFLFTLVMLINNRRNTTPSRELAEQ